MRLMELVEEVAQRTGREPSEVIPRVLSNWPTTETFNQTQVALMAWLLNRPEYIEIAKRRLRQGALAFTPCPTTEITTGVI